MAICVLLSSLLWVRGAVAQADAQVACPDVLILDVIPAKWEGAYWGSGGAVRSSGQNAWGMSWGLGAEVTKGLFTYHRFPFPRAGGPWDGRSELRGGLWTVFAVRSARVLIEGGPKLHLGGVLAPQWGTFDLRLGGGYGAFLEEGAPHISLTLLWGTRSVVKRYQNYGYCDPVPAPVFAEAGVLRFFITHRRALGSFSDREVVFGLELSPTLLFPPYSFSRLGGGYPYSFSK